MNGWMKEGITNKYINEVYKSIYDYLFNNIFDRIVYGVGLRYQSH